MNDFTKEELEDLMIIVGEWGNHELYTKIKSMIDNYCEHDQGYEQDSMMVDICKKCNEVF